MAYEIDHLLICTSIGALEADGLVNLGLLEGSPNIHVGQGTRNRRFFFRNSMLELLWVSDSDEARGETAGRTQLWDRWQGRNQVCSPYGVCLRRTSGKMKPPFAAWEYRPSFLPPDRSILIADDAPMIEPLWFFMTRGQRPDSIAVSQREPIEHPLGVREVTNVHFVIPGRDQRSAAARAVLETGLLTMAEGPGHLLEVTFDHHDMGQRHDFRPGLPLVMRW